MPTFRTDLHTGHDVPLIETDDLSNGAITHDKMADGAVDTNNILDGAVTPEKLNERVYEEVIEPPIDELSKRINDVEKESKEKDADLQNQIDSLEVSGMAISNLFGDDEHIGISQKTLTEAFNRVWSKIDEITGEHTTGISLVVSPEYFVGEDGADIHVTASSQGTGGMFDIISLYLNGELLISQENVETLEYDFHIDETSTLKCVAKILGIPYTEERNITHYHAFWLGGGSTASDVMIQADLIPITHGMRGSYDSTFSQGDHIIIVVDSTLRDGFRRADMNGFEIPFSETSQTISGKEYKVFTSLNTYNAGTYNIDINS